MASMHICTCVTLLLNQIAKTLYDMGCYEISLADTIGVATPGAIKKMLAEVVKLVPADKLGIHCHDTYGQAIANIFAALQVNLMALGCYISQGPYRSRYIPKVSA